MGEVLKFSLNAESKSADASMHEKEVDRENMYDRFCRIPFLQTIYTFRVYPEHQTEILEIVKNNSVEELFELLEKITEEDLCKNSTFYRLAIDVLRQRINDN